jgi:hypothetical protein
VAAAWALLCIGACTKKTGVELYVDGFEPENVRFEVEDLGVQTEEQLAALKKRRDIDGALLLPPSSCGDPSVSRSGREGPRLSRSGREGPCRAAIVSVYVSNKGPLDGEPEPPPVVRLRVPPGREPRLPIAFRGDEIQKGRVGRVRWLVEMWPEEERLTATLSSSVRLLPSPSPVSPAPVPPGGAP